MAKSKPIPKSDPYPFSLFSLDDWKNSPTHIAWAKAQFRDPLFRDMVAVLYNAGHTPAEPKDDTSAAYYLGMRVGYDLLLSMLMTLKDDPKPTIPPVEIDYGLDQENK